MANDLRNLTVRLSLDRLNFDQGLSSVNRALNTLRGELNSTRSGMGGFESESDRVRSRIDVLSRTIQAQEEKVRVLRTSYEQSAQATGENSRATQIYAAQVNRAIAELNRMQGELTQTTEQLHRMETSTNNFSQRMETMGNRLQNAGMQIGMVFGSIAMAVGGALKDAISTGAEFESEIAKVGSKSDASAEDLKKLSDTAIKLAPLAGGAKNAATAMDDLAAKGYSVNQIMEAMPGILSAANASGEDLALTSDTITSALEAFHLKATDTSHVADVLAKTANLTAAGMSDLQYTFKYAAAPAAQLGISMEQLAAMTGLMANQGIKGEQAGTSLREAMLRLVNPPKAAANELHDLGVKVTDNQGKFRSFSDIIGDLNKSTEKMTNAQKAAAVEHIFGMNAVSGMLAVMSGGKGKIDDFTTALQNSDGASAKAAAEMQDNFAGSLKKLNGAIDAAKIGIEQALAPALRVIADEIQKAVVGFNNLSPSMKQFISIGLAVTAVIATIGTVIGGALAASGAIMSAIGALGISFGGLLVPIGLVVAGLGLVAVAAIGIKKAMDDSKQANLDHVQSLLDQKKSLDDLTTSYNSLRDKNKLSNDELLRFRDIQTELKTAKSADEIKQLSDESAKLQQKSGLTNDELSHMLSLNDDIIKKTPDVKQSFSDRGNAIIQNKDALKEVNDKLAENIRLELENQRIKAEANLTQNIQNYIKALDELKAKEKERDDAIKARDATDKQVSDLKIKAQQQINSGKDSEAQKTIDEIANEQILLGKQNSKVNSLADEVTQKQNSVNKTQDEITKTQQLYDKMVNLQLTQVGINAQGQEGINQLDQAISKTQTRIGELDKAKQSQGGLNTAQQTELTNLQNALGQYQSTKNEIGKIQSAQDTVNQKIDDATGKANAMNSSLSLRAVKEVNIDDHGQADSLNEKVSKEVTKKVTLQAVLDGLSTGLQTALKVAGFAKGTDNAPGGLAVVGEEGPELMYVPKGSVIKTASETRSILNNNGGSNGNKGGNTFNFYPQKAIIDKDDITRELQRMEVLYG